MKRKFNKILSALLLSVMLFTTVSAALPLVSSAASSESYVQDANASQSNYKEVITDALKNDRTAAESLAYDKEKGILDSYKSGDFSIYINRYTGLVTM